MHDVVDLTDIAGHDLRYRKLASHVMSSALPYYVVGFLHHVAYDISCNIALAYDVAFDSIQVMSGQLVDVCVLDLKKPIPSR